MSYNVGSRDYLNRAKSLLDSGDKAALFYAAFELRCGIESRMGEYLEAQKHISAKKKKGWQVAKLAKNIEDAFRTGEKKATVIVLDSISKKRLLEAQYTPVRKYGRKIAEQLGNYMHKAKCHHSGVEPYWDIFANILDKGVQELEFSTSGILLGPPLMKTKTGEGFMYLEDHEQQLLEHLQGYEKIIFKVEYE